MGRRAHQLIKGAISAVAAVFVVSVSIVAPAADAGTNFPALSDYPAPACVKPGSMPSRAANEAANEYHQKTAQYGAAQQAYIACMNAYVARAKADLDLIRSKANRATPIFLRSRIILRPAAANQWVCRCHPIWERRLARTLGPGLPGTTTRRARNMKYDVYASCMNAYTANAQADMDLIVDKVKRAVAGDVLAPAADDPNNWVTFKTGNSAFGPTQHQVNRKSIRQEGPYMTFWTRIWIVPLQEGLVHSDVVEEQLTRWSEKFAVDCAHHKWGPQFIDSTDPSDKNDSASLKTMPWVSLDEAPVIAQVVCTAPLTASQ